MIKLPKISRSLKNKRILMRVDFNVPCRLGKVEDDFRIKKTLPTIKQLLKKKNLVILMSHFEVDGQTPSLLHIASFLKRHGLSRLRFSADIAGGKTKKLIEKTNHSNVILLENLRKDGREKKNTAGFAKELAGLADAYVNEAFSASHREHASIVGLPKYLPSYAGPLFIEEVKHLKRAFRPQKPFVLILGGNKFDTKAPLLAKFLRKSTHIIIGGAIANTFIAAKGYKVGVSQMEEGALKIIRKKYIKSAKIIMPLDVVIKRKNRKKSVFLDDIQKSDLIYDLGPETQKMIEPIIKSAKFVLWNGPVGFVEGGYDSGTRAIVEAVVGSRAESIVGGGDTVAYIDKLGLANKFSFLSTGGGAMLEFLANKTLPGIEALSKK